MLDLSKLKELSENATPRPWMVDGPKALGAYSIWQNEFLGTEDAVLICRMTDFDGPALESKERRNSDSALIVYVINNLEEIIKCLEQKGQ